MSENLIMYKSVKRVCDFCFSFFGILILIPLILPTIVVLKLTGEGMVFYRQKRLGLKQRDFFILKFATMLIDSPNIGQKSITVRNDPRITKVGKYLRITKLNEIPQLFNVLNGEMSFVGARPLPKKSFLKYSEKVQKLIYQTRPGITGIGSLIFRDEELLVSYVKEKNIDPLLYYKYYIYPYKGQLETWYQKNISFYTDMMILLLTFYYVVNPKANSAYRVFKDLPIRPNAISMEGISSNIIHKLTFLDE